jgi:hypothetical protein
MKLKGPHFANVAEIQEAVTDELNKVQKKELSVTFQKVYGRANTYIYLYANKAYFELKKSYVSSSCVFDLKKSALKLLDRTV